MSGVQQFHSIGTLARSLRRYPRYGVYRKVDEPSLGQGVPGLERSLKPVVGYPLDVATSRKGYRLTAQQSRRSDVKFGVYLVQQSFRKIFQISVSGKII